MTVSQVGLHAGSITINSAYTFPTADGTADQVLTTDGSGTLSFATASGGGGGDVVEDTTPQLGGDLDVNGQSIVSVSNGDINITPNGTGSVLVGATSGSGALTIDADSSTTNNRALHITITDDDPTATTYATFIDYNITGATATGGDTTHIALTVDTDSSATGGDTADEHRVYGIYNTVDVSGDSDLVYGQFNDMRVSHSEGTISNLNGVYTLLESDNSGGTVGTATANRNLMYVNGTGNTTTAYADYNFTYLQDPSTTTNAYGSYNEVQIETNATVTNVFGVRSLIDENGGSSTAQYLFHGQYDGTPSGTGYGLYITGETKNYISGAVGIGATSPTTSLEINAANTLGATFTGITAGEGVEVSQTSYTADNYVSLIEGKYLASQSAPHVRIGAQYTGGGSKLVFGTSNSYGSGITNSALTIDPSGNATFSANVTASYLIGTATSALYADLAEKYVADAHYEPGTVMVIGGDKEVTASNSYMDPTVSGIVSTNPAFLMNKDLTAEHVVDLALTGRVPCKVHGIIKRGDMIFFTASHRSRQ